MITNNARQTQKTVPPVDRELRGPLEQILRNRPSSITPDQIAADRQRILEQRLEDHEITRGGAFNIATYLLTEHDPHGEVSVLVVRPSGVGGAVPVMFSIHGGGMFAGHNRSPELRRELDQALELGLAIVSVNYRLAPEYPDPTPVDDCYASFQWTVKHADELGLDPKRLVITGASAGAALAAGVALRARDLGGPDILGQMLLCPMLDDRVDSCSSDQLRGHGIWDSTSSLTGWDALLGDRRGTRDVSPYAAPARATSLGDLPPTYIEVGTFEALRDEAVDFANRVASHGGDVELHMWGGAFHSFDEWVPAATVSRTARRARVDWLRRLFGVPR